MNESEEDSSLSSSLDEKFRQFQSNRSVTNWESCPSYKRQELITKDAVFKTITMARNAAILRLSNFQPALIQRQNQTLITDQEKAEIPPLFQKVSSTIIQSTVECLKKCGFLTKQEIFAPIILWYFEEENPEAAPIFVNLAFPAIFFYFLTDEFTECGMKLIRQLMVIKRNDFTSSLLATAIDCFPRFTETLWSTIDEFSQKESVFKALQKALPIALRHLPTHHLNLIKELSVLDLQFLASFLFAKYLPPRMTIRYADNRTANKKMIDELTQIFGLAHTSHQRLIMSAIVDADIAGITQVSFLSDIALDSVYTAMSPAEMCILWDFFIANNLMKSTRVRITEDHRTSLECGYVQWMPQVFNKKQSANHFLIFKNQKHSVEKVQIYERIWNRLNKVSIEEHQQVIDMLVKPNTPHGYAMVSLPAVQSPEFKNYVIERTKEKDAESQERLEIFVQKLETWKELAAIRDDYRRNISFYMYNLSKGFVLNACMTHATADRRPEETELSADAVFMRNRYRQVRPPKQEQTDSCLGANFVPLSKNFEDVMEVISNARFPNIYASKCVQVLINEWSSDSSPETLKINEMYDEFVWCHRSMLCNNAAFYKLVSANRQLQILCGKLKSLSELRMGSRIFEITHIIRELVEISTILATEIPRSMITCNCIILYGGKELLWTTVWFMRMSSQYPQYMDTLSRDVLELMSSTVHEYYAMIRTHNRQLADMIRSTAMFFPQLCDK